MTNSRFGKVKELPLYIVSGRDMSYIHHNLCLRLKWNRTFCGLMKIYILRVYNSSAFMSSAAAAEAVSHKGSRNTRLLLQFMVLLPNVM